MLENYLIIHKSILPEYYEKVLQVRRLMESGRIKEISHYKYKDFIFEPSDMAEGRKAVLSVMLDHEPGVLSALLARVSEAEGSVLTITQSLPIHSKASVTISLDISSMPGSLSDLLAAIENTPGVENPRLLAVE